jgi:XTP/dITP diphosphohydrolase
MRLQRGDTLVIATHNQGKLREFAGLVAPHGLKAVSSGDLGLPEPEETGDSFEANARLKAIAAAKAAGLPALADDSGVAVDALAGAPGIYSARWAGPTRDFTIAMAKVEEELRERQADAAADRRARFVAVVALASPDGESETWRGETEGTLIWPPRGANGFGYDPMFEPAGHDRTFGEMSAEEKHAFSHRARAFALFAAAKLRP